jgi:hypothetical protein
MEVVDILERTALISWDQVVRWAALVAAMLIAKAMAAALVTTRLMPVHRDKAAIAAPSRN